MPGPVSDSPDSYFPLGADPVIMGIVNVTPDSFSDGGVAYELSSAVDHAVHLLEEGADILDIGGESTRPGSEPVSAQEEIRRVVPVIQALRDRYPEHPISIDTSKADVAEAALVAGATMVNDVSAGRGDPNMFSVVQDHQVGIILMHMQGNPKTMQEEPSYVDVVDEVVSFFKERTEAAIHAGISANAIAVDPGIGFGKTLEHNLKLMANLPVLKDLGFPLLLGVSRKRWIGELTGQPVEQRVAGSIAGAIACVQKGADMVRVHDVRETQDALRITCAILRDEHGKG